MAFKDFTEFMKEPLRLPLNGKIYEIKAPSLDAGLRMTKIFQDGENDKTPVTDQYELVLGETYALMKADNVPSEFAARVFLTAIADFNYGREMAEATWEAGTDPEALAAYLARRKVTESEESTNTGEDI